MRRILEALLFASLCAAMFVIGFNAGLCVKVFMTRGVPVVNGGGELLLLVALPACVLIGFQLGYGKKCRKQLDYSDEICEEDNK